MALAKLKELIGEELLQRFAVDRAALVHRLGHLEIGETSVLVAVTSAHRAAAFDACRFGIDTLKRVVPIWKRRNTSRTARHVGARRGPGRYSVRSPAIQFTPVRESMS